MFTFDLGDMPPNKTNMEPENPMSLKSKIILQTSMTLGSFAFRLTRGVIQVDVLFIRVGGIS